jgi:hypothetical protein
MADDNSYMDLTLSAGGYNTNGGSGALQANDFTVSFNRNGGVATNAVVSSIKKNNNTSEGSAGALSGGETVIRMFLTLTGTPGGVEILTVTANSNSIYNSSGTAMSNSSALSVPLKDKNGPYITGIEIAETVELSSAISIPVI